MQIAGRSFVKQLLRVYVLFGVGFFAGCAFGGFVAGMARPLIQ